MCGIAGILGIDRAVAEPAIERMLYALKHRGPDAQRSAIFAVDRDGPPIALAHARLAIIDLSSDGIQPMNDAEGERTIVFNGEIYNYRELKKELEALGHSFRTATDTEVILRAYREWGDDAFSHLRGMFALVLIDRPRARVLFARDRLGIKPLYLARTNGGLLFASEVRALLAAGSDLIAPEIDRVAMESFFAQGMVCGMQSIVSGVSMLEPATILITTLQGLEIERKRFWSLRAGGDHFDRRDDATRKLGTALREAVAGHLISDVPLGLFLSGGIDSGALTTIATEIGNTKVRSIGVGFDEKAFDESDDAARVAKTLGTDHQTLRLAGADMLADIDEVFAAMDQPTVDGFNTFFVSRAAKRAGLTVALSGLGGDELFGGYASFRDVPIAAGLSALVRHPRFLRRATARVLKLPGRRGVKVRELLDRAPGMVGSYLLRRELLLPDERRSLFERPSASDPTTGLPNTTVTELETIAKGNDPRNTISLLEISSYMRDMLLRDSDVFSMSVGLELRVPLLDHEVVDLATSFPGKWKKSDGRLKPLLVDATGPRLPTATNRTKKKGFTFPWSAWLRGPLRARAEKAIANREIWRTLGVNEAAPEKLFERFLKNDPRVGGLEVLALWVLAEYAQRQGLRS